MVLPELDESARGRMASQSSGSDFGEYGMRLTAFQNDLIFDLGVRTSSRRPQRRAQTCIYSWSFPHRKPSNRFSRMLFSIFDFELPGHFHCF